MATLLTKEIKRELRVTKSQGRETLIVSLCPDETLKFRLKGRRVEYEVPLKVCYLKALEFFINHQYKEKVKTYQEKKKAGMKVRRPSPPVRFGV